MRMLLTRDVETLHGELKEDVEFIADSDVVLERVTVWHTRRPSVIVES